MAGIINRLKNFFFRQQAQDIMDSQNTTAGLTSEQSKDKTELGISEEVVVSLLQQVQSTKEGQYSCAESYALLDEYVELAVSDEDVENLMPLVKAHLEACPDCKLEFEILRKVLETDK